MVRGFLAEKKGYYYSVLNYQDKNGKWKKKWVSTGYPVKTGNKNKAMRALDEARMNFKPPERPDSMDSDNVLFADYLEDYWLPVAKNNVRPSTYYNYESKVTSRIAPYFRERGVRLCDLNARHIQDYYNERQRTCKPSTVRTHHAIIHRALEHARRIGSIASNPADLTERPRMELRNAQFYMPEEVEELVRASKDDPIGLIIKFTAFYGFRRSEAIGLKWSAIDWEKNRLTVRHTVIKVRDEEHGTRLEKSDTTKNSASYRTMPLVDTFRADLLKRKEEIEQHKQWCGSAYNHEYDEYIFVNQIGDLIDPDYVSRHFRIVLKHAGLRKIRFHDLRHSCASMLVRHGVPMKMVQEWLGHSDYSTTANIYSHLGYESKEETAKAMLEALSFEE